MNYKEWLESAKIEKPELADFIAKLEVDISETGFNLAAFEKKVTAGLNKIEADVKKSFIPDSHA